MGKTWVLDTGTKGTGASVVPLDRDEQKQQPRRAEDRGYVPPAPRRDQPRRRAPQPAPKAPRRFRIVDLLTRATLADDVDLRTALRVLRDDVRSSLDVHVLVHEPRRDTWRLLTMGEQRALWDARGVTPPGA